MTAPHDKSEGLEPCPFCGHDAIEKKIDHPYWDRCIMCTVCCCKTDEYSSGNESHMAAMREAWNRRSPPAPQAALTGEQREAIEDAIAALENERHEARTRSGWYDTSTASFRKYDREARNAARAMDTLRALAGKGEA